jgi:hypothetical protein
MRRITLNELASFARSPQVFALRTLVLGMASDKEAQEALLALNGYWSAVL